MWGCRPLGPSECNFAFSVKRRGQFVVLLQIPQIAAYEEDRDRDGNNDGNKKYS